MAEGKSGLRSGRGGKDVMQAAKIRGVELQEQSVARKKYNNEQTPQLLEGKGN